MTHQDDELSRLLDRVPVTADRPRTVQPLSGGLTNSNYRVTTDDGDYVVRCFPDGPDHLGIDRDAEHRNSIAAAEAGVGAPVVDYHPDLGLLVIGYLDGVTWDNETFRDEDTVTRAGGAIRTLHDGPRFSGEFDMFARQAHYRERLLAGDGIPFAGYDEQRPAFLRVADALAVHPAATVPCNNDLLAANFIDDGSKVWLIDYEYGGNNDPCFELGNTSTECDLDDDRTEALVAAYFGRVQRATLARVRLQALVSAYGWALWGATQASTRGQQEFDYETWGRERFEKAARGFTSASFGRLLEEVTGEQ